MAKQKSLEQLRAEKVVLCQEKVQIKHAFF